MQVERVMQRMTEFDSDYSKMMNFAAVYDTKNSAEKKAVTISQSESNSWVQVRILVKCVIARPHQAPCGWTLSRQIRLSILRRCLLLVFLFWCIKLQQEDKSDSKDDVISHELNVMLIGTHLLLLARLFSQSVIFFNFYGAGCWVRTKIIYLRKLNSRKLNKVQNR